MGTVTTDEATVICADADGDGRRATVDSLAGAGIDVFEAESIADVTQLLDRTVDCVVTAASFPDGDAFDVVDVVRTEYPDCSCVLFTEEPPSDLPHGGPAQVVEYVPRSVPDAHDRLRNVVAASIESVTQAAYPVPGDERERLGAVRRYDVDSLAAEETFARLTTLMTGHFDIDVAFVGLVDEHEERFVACEGANWSTLTREDTICTHTILSDDVMVVEDTHEDPRFASNQTLDDLDIRSYAGVRITDEDGNALGAVCCTDTEPRSYTRLELDDLRRFAAEVEEQLQLRRRLDAGDD